MLNPQIDVWFPPKIKRHVSRPFWFGSCNMCEGFPGENPQMVQQTSPKKNNGDISSARWGERVRMWMFFVLNIDTVDGRNPANHLLSMKPYEKYG